MLASDEAPPTVVPARVEAPRAHALAASVAATGATAILRLLRPRQWYKNGILLVPLIFSANLFTWALWPHVLLALAAFCLLSGGVYAINDVLDRERDRLHPKKRFRPVAAGTVSPATASVVGLVTVAAGLGLLWFVNPATLLIGAVFIGLQAIYNIVLKNTLLWDALGIAIGFVLRALAGTTAIMVGEPTVWLIVCTFLFAFYLALAKRRHEVLLAQDDPSTINHRPILGEYTVPFLDQTMQVATSVLLVAYSLYTFFGTDSWMMLTLPFAFYGILRYNFLVHRRDLGDEAEMIFTDRPTILNAIAWLLVAVLVLEGSLPRFFTWFGGL